MFLDDDKHRIAFGDPGRIDAKMRRAAVAQARETVEDDEPYDVELHGWEEQQISKGVSRLATSMNCYIYIYVCLS